MVQYTLRRLLVMLPLVLLVSLGTFALVLLIPGDPAITISGENATERQINATRERLGLDDPVFVQYGRWAGNALRGDLGTSLFSSEKVTTSIVDRFPVTLSLTLASMLVGLLIAVPAAIISATHRGQWQDRLATLGSSAGIAVPNFWLGIMLLLLFSLELGWLPAIGYIPFFSDPVGWLRHMTLPAITLGTAAAAETTRQLRSSMSETLDQDFIRTARATGLPRGVVIFKHALKNAAVPAVTVLGFQLAFLLGGSVIVEQIFGLPGLGDLAIRAVLERDIPRIQGIVVVTAVVVMLVNLLVDLVYAWLNPKVRAA
jgi:peptide/nickel transport system permease protein